MDKAKLRKKLLDERDRLTEARRAELSSAVVGHLRAWLTGRAVDVVALYHPFRGEPDVLALARSGNGLAFALPVIGERPGEMVFHAYKAGDPLVKSRLGTLEPERSQPVVAFSSRSVAMVPALSLDETGARLGYGGGYYDRFLGDFPGTAIGVVFRSMMVGRLPVLPHDVHLPFAVTEEGVTASERP